MYRIGIAACGGFLVAVSLLRIPVCECERSEGPRHEVEPKRSAPLVDPLGPDWPCPPCTLYTSTSELEGTLDASYNKFPYPFTNGTLSALDASGNTLATAPLAPDRQYGGTDLDQTVTFTPSVNPNDIKGASIRWIAKNGAVVTQPNIPVLP